MEIPETWQQSDCEEYLPLAGRSRNPIVDSPLTCESQLQDNGMLSCIRAIQLPCMLTIPGTTNIVRASVLQNAV